MIPGLKAIPAFNGAGSSGSGGGGVTTLSFVGFATSSGSTITIPSGAIEGDWAILFDAAINAAGSSIGAITPSGWTNLASTFGSGSDSMRVMTSHRILGASPGGTTVTGMNDSAEGKFMLVFRPSSSITSTTPSAWNAQVTTGDPTLQTVSASGISTPLVVVAFAACDAGVSYAIPSFTTETPAMTNLTIGAVSGLGVRLGYTLYNTSPSDQSIDIADGGLNNGLQSGYVRFT